MDKYIKYKIIFMLMDLIISSCNLLCIYIFICATKVSFFCSIKEKIGENYNNLHIILKIKSYWKSLLLWAFNFIGGCPHLAKGIRLGGTNVGLNILVYSFFRSTATLRMMYKRRGSLPPSLTTYRIHMKHVPLNLEWGILIACYSKDLGD